MSSNGRTVFLAMMAGAALTMLAAAQSQVSWRYYRPGNTGIQGDYNESIWIDTDGDPWISGYDPIAEEGGVAKFIQADRRWINVSNIDYPLFGSANDVGTSRVSDMIDDGQGNVWLGTWRGLLRMNLAAGPSSLEKFGPENSPLPGGLTRDITRAPDGSIWVSAESANWAGGGLTRYQPSTGTWTHFDGRGGGRIAAQPKSSGGIVSRRCGLTSRMPSAIRWRWSRRTRSMPAATCGYSDSQMTKDSGHLIACVQMGPGSHQRCLHFRLHFPLRLQRSSRLVSFRRISS
jgi:streptogramin lyase